MSLESVRAWLAEHAPELRLIEVAESTATVAAAAAALGVAPARIAKTLAVRAGDETFLLVARGDARLDNAKTKAEFRARPRMLGAEETLALTGHPVGGVCPFGTARLTFRGPDMFNFPRSRAALAGAAFAAATFASATPAMAGTASGSLSVTATVTANCTVSTTALAFGSVNTISGSNVDSTGGLTITCTNGAAWSASAGVGSGTGASFANRKMAAGANLLNYNIYTTPARTIVWGDGTSSTAAITGTGTGGAQSVTVYGRVASGQTSVPAGSYADTVAVTITY